MAYHKILGVYLENSESETGRPIARSLNWPTLVHMYSLKSSNGSSKSGDMDISPLRLPNSLIFFGGSTLALTCLNLRKSIKSSTCCFISGGSKEYRLNSASDILENKQECLAAQVQLGEKWTRITNEKGRTVALPFSINL